MYGKREYKTFLCKKERHEQKSLFNTETTKLHCLYLYRCYLRFCGNEIKAYHKTSGAGMMPFDLCFTSRLEWLTHF